MLVLSVWSVLKGFTNGTCSINNSSTNKTELTATQVIIAFFLITKSLSENLDIINILVQAFRYKMSYGSYTKIKIRLEFDYKKLIFLIEL